MADGAAMVQQTEARLKAFRRQAAARSAEAQTALFTEIGKTLSALAQHPRLKDDIHFAHLLEQLAGAEDTEAFHDRAARLGDYVRKTAVAHGAPVEAVAGSGVGRSGLSSIPDHLSDLHDAATPRTRLKMR